MTLPGSDVALFPLQTVLFPGGLLPLRIFEQRYLDMTKACIRDANPFGVCLLREGAEVGTPALPHQVGCMALIEHWEMPHLGLFHLLCRGTSVFRIAEHWSTPAGLVRARVDVAQSPLLYLDLAYAQAKKDGKLRSLADLQEAIRYGAVKRLRPKFMTVTTTFLGLIPILWSLGAGADVMKRIAAPMIGGIFTSFLLELIV